jgi:hypothetical protein
MHASAALSRLLLPANAASCDCCTSMCRCAADASQRTAGHWVGVCFLHYFIHNTQSAVRTSYCLKMGSHNTANDHGLRMPT